MTSNALPRQSHHPVGFGCPVGSAFFCQKQRQQRLKQWSVLLDGWQMAPQAGTRNSAIVKRKVTCWHFRLTCRLTFARSRQIFTRALMRSNTLSLRCLKAQSSSVRANVPHGRASGHRQPQLPAPSTESPRQREKTKRPVSVARYRSCAAGRRPRCLGRLQHGSGCGPNPYDCAVRSRESTLNESISNPQKFVLIRVHSWFKYPTPPTPRKTPAQAHSTNQVPTQKNSCPFVVQIPPPSCHFPLRRL